MVFECDQKTTDWISGMEGALHYMGGVPVLIVPDNPRAVIARADRYEPRATDNIQDFCPPSWAKNCSTSACVRPLLPIHIGLP